ncbi:MAG: ATP-binding domain-containing protein, partial [Myxococcales bacterium]|nr:ATP-binding domain-containing protein [Myxococcales bacterium]
VGGLRFYDRAEIKDLVAYLKLVANPDDPVSLERIINKPARGIGKVTLEKCAAYAADQGISLWRGVREIAGDGGSIGGKLEPFVKLMDELAEVAASGSALAVIQAVLEGTQYIELLEKDGTVEAQARIENVKELVGAIAEFTERVEGDRSLGAFLDEVSLVSDIDQVDDDGDACVMMTAHTAKGLEFDVVFVTGLEEGLFPHFNSSDSDDGVEEERRLAYVAMTRARQRLHLTYALSRRRFGQSSSATASRFLDGLPQGAVETEASSYRPPPPLGSGRWDARNRVAPADDDPAMDYVYDVPDYADESQDPSDGPGPGSAVFHPQFGQGRIVDIEGQGERAKARVRFADGETRKLMARFLTLL